MQKFEKIVEYGLYILVFLLPAQTRWIIRPGVINGGYFEYGTISLYATDILLIFLLFGFAFLKWQRTDAEGRTPKDGRRRTDIWFLISGFLFFVFISIFSAPDKLVALSGYIRVLSGVGLFWLVTQAGYKRLKLICFFLAGVFIQAALGIWQFLGQSTFSSKWLGMALHNASDPGTSVIETLSGERWLRAYGGLDHPNVLGGLLALGILTTIFLILRSGKTAQSLPAGRADPAGDYGEAEISHNNHEFNFQFSIFPPEADPRLANRPASLADNFQSIFNFKYRILKLFVLYFLLLTFLSALFFTFSRGAWAGLLVGLMAALIMLVIKKNFPAQKNLLKIILSAGLLVFILFNIFSDLVLTRLSQDTRLEAKSNTERVESLKAAKVIIKNHWLFGTGIGNYTQILRSEINDSLPSYAYQPVHNTFLLVWAETGVFALLFYLAIIFVLIIFNFSAKGGFLLCRPAGAAGGQFSIFPPKADSCFAGRQAPPADKQYQIFNFQNSLPVLISIVAMALVDHWWWSLHFGWLLFWFALGIMAQRRQKIYP